MREIVTTIERPMDAFRNSLESIGSPNIPNDSATTTPTNYSPYSSNTLNGHDERPSNICVGGEEQTNGLSVTSNSISNDLLEDSLTNLSLNMNDEEDRRMSVERLHEMDSDSRRQHLPPQALRMSSLDDLPLHDSNRRVAPNPVMRQPRLPPAASGTNNTSHQPSWSNSTTQASNRPPQASNNGASQANTGAIRKIRSPPTQQTNENSATSS